MQTIFDPSGTFVDANGILQVRFIKHFDDGTQGYHRISVVPGAEVDSLISSVNANLESMGAAPIEDYSALQSMCTTVQTKEVIDSFKSKINDSFIKKERK